MHVKIGWRRIVFILFAAVVYSIFIFIWINSFHKVASKSTNGSVTIELTTSSTWSSEETKLHLINNSSNQKYLLYETSVHDLWEEGIEEERNEILWHPDGKRFICTIGRFAVPGGSYTDIIGFAPQSNPPYAHEIELGNWVKEVFRSALKTRDPEKRKTVQKLVNDLATDGEHQGFVVP